MYIDLGYTGYKKFHSCYIKYLTEKEQFQLAEYNSSCFLSNEKTTDDKNCWTYLIRRKALFKEIEQDFQSYRENLTIEILFKIETKLKNLEIPYFEGVRAKVFIIDELAEELCNEFYNKQKRSHFVNMDSEAVIFSEQRIKQVLLPYLEKCGLFVDEMEIEKCLDEVKKDFKKILLDSNYQYGGKKDTLIEKINLSVELFGEIVNLQKEGKLPKKFMLKDFLTKEFRDGLIDRRKLKSRYIIEALVKSYESKILNQYNKIIDSFVINSFVEFILLEIHRFLNKRPNVSVCERCGQMFIGEHKNKTYCPYIFNGEICEAVGKNEARKQKEEMYPGLKCYDRIYSRMKKRIKSQNMIGNKSLESKYKKEFYSWEEYSGLLREKYRGNLITQKEFEEAIKEKYREITGEINA